MSFLAHTVREAAGIPVELHEDVQVTPSGGEQRTIQAIVKRLSEVTDIGEMIQMDGVAATANAASSAVTDLAIGDLATARGTAYRIVGVEPRGISRTILVLGI